ncbi:MAG: rhodanese-like domain-containing protein [Proteobacteria bacterium]|jgi:rhodanese-related sulfurtransferase|nr:rhodanese-like domain-containing protein [Pseudomonadota bacterium]
MIHNNNFLSLVEEYRPLIKEVDVEYVKTKLDNKEDFTLIDVREDHEWNRGHIPTAIHMARGIIEINIEKIIPQKDTHIVLYCGGGFRSVLSAYNLQKMGYNNVVSMDGGISTWINFGYNITL